MSNLAITTIDLATPNINLFPSIKFSTLRPHAKDGVFTRTSQATLLINDLTRVIYPDMIRYDKEVEAFIIEPASTNYFKQDYTIFGQHVTGSDIEGNNSLEYVVLDDNYVQLGNQYVVLTPGVPESQTLTLPSGEYTLSVLGDVMATVSALTAVGTGFGTAMRDNDVYLDITTGGTVSVVIYNAEVGDIVQLEKCPASTTYIPNSTSQTSTTRTVERLSIPIDGLTTIYGG